MNFRKSDKSDAVIVGRIHTKETERRVKALLKNGVGYRFLIRSLRGLVDKTVINRWACELRVENDNALHERDDT